MEQEVRCANCNRKLAMGVFQLLNIKCPRCGTLNSLRVQATPPTRVPPRAFDSIH